MITGCPFAWLVGLGHRSCYRRAVEWRSDRAGRRTPRLGNGALRYGLPGPSGTPSVQRPCMIRSGTDSQDKAGFLSARLRQNGEEELAVDFDRHRDGLGRLLHRHHVLREEQDAGPDIRPPNVAMRAMRPKRTDSEADRRGVRDRHRFRLTTCHFEVGPSATATQTNCFQTPSRISSRR